jgi:long-chain acyl-CoA synthetase
MQAHPWHSQYDPGVPIEIDYDELTLPALLERSVARYADRPALVFVNRRMTYGELQADVARLASGLATLGVEPGTRVAVQLPNLPQTVIAFYAALSLGAEVVMTNPLYTLRELQHQWKDADCAVAITADFIWDAVIRQQRDGLNPRHYVVCHLNDYLRFPLNVLAPFKLKRQRPRRWAKVAPGPGVQTFKQLMAGASGPPPRPTIAWDACAVLQYTGGTTGPSKGAVLSHANLSCNAQQVDAWFTGVEYGREVLMTALPLFHVFGLTVCMNWSVLTGACQVLQPNPRDIPALVKAIAKHRVTLFPGVPALFNGLNQHPGIDAIDVSSVKACFSGSAPIPDDVLQRFESLTGATIIEGFGMSETSPVTHVNPLRGRRKLGSVGVPVSDTEARIVDVDSGADVPVGAEGELLVRGPQVMSGYWERPEETAAALAGGWMHTGDLAVMDEDGFFRIVGRMKDMINCGGLKVFPDEVDNVLMAHDAILEAATIGVPDETRGETVKSFIVLRPGKTLDEQELEAYCRENLAAYKIPRQVEFLDELPKSSVLKVLRRELRDMELAKRGS